MARPRRLPDQAPTPTIPPLTARQLALVGAATMAWVVVGAYTFAALERDPALASRLQVRVGEVVDEGQLYRGAAAGC